MKRIFMLNALLVATIILMPLTASYAAGVKIGVIDTRRIMRESKAAKRARDICFKDFEAKKAVFGAKQKKVTALEGELKTEGKKMSASLRKEETEKLAQEIKELKRLKNDLEEELKRKDLELTRKLLQEIGEVVKEFSKKEKYTVILEKKSVVVADEGIAITDKIIRLYDAIK